MACINEIGNTYGYLKVVARAPNNKDGRAMWECECRCGNKVIVLGKHLRSGNTQSCGCYQRERATQSNLDRGGDLTHKRFGKLYVLEEAGFIAKNSGRNARLWKCQCDCGNICYVQHQYLTYGDVHSCGCLRSTGENQIETLLKEHNINFKREVQFDDLADKLNLRFDFGIYDNDALKCLIEFQGEQHWCSSNGFYSNTLVKHDEMKKNYCQSHNIPLYFFYYKGAREQQVSWEDLKNIKEIKEQLDEL